MELYGCVYDYAWTHFKTKSNESESETAESKKRKTVMMALWKLWVAPARKNGIFSPLSE